MMHKLLAWLERRILRQRWYVLYPFTDGCVQHDAGTNVYSADLSRPFGNKIVFGVSKASPPPGWPVAFDAIRRKSEFARTMEAALKG